MIYDREVSISVIFFFSREIVLAAGSYADNACKLSVTTDDVSDCKLQPRRTPPPSPPPPPSSDADRPGYCSEAGNVTSSHRAGQGVSDLARAWNSGERDKIDGDDR